MHTHYGQILRLPDVLAFTGLSRSSIYLSIAKGLWTKPVKLGARAVGWPINEALAINGGRIAGKSEAEIRALVEQLEAARKTAAQKVAMTELTIQQKRGWQRGVRK